jgi:hypothetical protein
MTWNRELRTCSSCGTTLSSSGALEPANPDARNRTLPADVLCLQCQLKQSFSREMALADECPQCHATMIQRAPAGPREEISYVRSVITSGLGAARDFTWELTAGGSKTSSFILNGRDHSWV